ncbi:MAG: hypothetical protein H0X25_11220 [Acidobacteriales bacterium]|nr:hypothetical protein [Terriglobales bacterium]
MALIDVMEYLVAPQPFAAENHLGSLVAGTNPTYSYWDVPNHRMFLMKGLYHDPKSGVAIGGFPWDVNIVEEDFVYQWATELSWSDPRQFKAFASKSWPNGKGGIVWCQRFVAPGAFSAPIVTADSTYNEYASCVPGPSKTLGGPIMTKIEGPITTNLGGMLGPSQECLVQSYFWGPGFINMEVNYYALGFGHVQWQFWTLQNGLYDVKDVKLFNQIILGGSPAPYFPCVLP